MKNSTSLRFLLGCAFLLPALLAYSQRITVTNSLDLGPGSLRDAISVANYGDTIDFSALTDNIPIVLLSGELVLDSALVIEGNGLGITTINGGTTNQLFNITDAESVTFRNITFTSGVSSISGGAISALNTDVYLDSVNIINCVASGALAKQGGGAIYAKNGDVHITNGSIISDNMADGASGSGGAILLDSAANLYISDSELSRNTASRAGGAIESNTGGNTVVDIVSSMFVGNTTGATPGNGGALHITGLGDVIVSRSIFNGNIASAEGGALWNGNGAMTIMRSLFINNIANGNDASNGGGALFNLRGTMTVGDSTQIEYNQAAGTSGSGGGIFNDSAATLIINQSFVRYNIANRAGGGIEDQSGPLSSMTFTDLVLDSNIVNTNPGNGGGLHISGAGSVTITGGRANGNVAGSEGGALWNGAGTMTVSNFVIDGNIANGVGSDQGGAGIYNLRGLLEINNTQIINNRADSGSASGGGILIDAGAGLIIRNSVVSNNFAKRAGGGIEDNSGSSTILTLDKVTLSNNVASASPGNGGGVHITGAGNMSIKSSIVSNNTAGAEGGGLWNGSGTMTVDGTLISNNIAQGKDPDQGGGGIYNLSGSLTVNNSIIRGNAVDSASASGGGILNDVNGTLTVNNSAIIGNRAKRAGGGIEDNSGATTIVTLTDVNLDSNSVASAPGNGGGLHVTGAGNVIVSGGTANGNIASAEGGAFWNGAGTMTVTGTTINGNKANGKLADQGGAGFYNLSGNLIVSNVTISNNRADSGSASGGGILNDVGGSLQVINSTLTGNHANRAGGAIEDVSGNATMMKISSSVFANNNAGASPGNGGAIHITGNGNAEILGGRFTNNSAASEGGAAWNGSGNMNIYGVVFSGNKASGASADQGGGALYNLSGVMSVSGVTQFSANSANGASGSGGAILNDVGATLIIDSVLFSSNTASRAGGAIEDNSGAGSNVAISNTRFDLNSTGSAPGNGGAIHISGAGNMNITNTLATNNTAAREGGAFWNGSGVMQVSNVRFEGNVASGPAADDGGGSLFNNGGIVLLENSSISTSSADGVSGSGGAVFNNNGTIGIYRTTISGNNALNTGGGVFNNGTMFVSNSTIANNTATMKGGGLYQGASTDTVLVIESVLASNVAPIGFDIAADSGFVSSNDYNLIGIDDLNSFSALSNDLVGTPTSPVSANFMPLQDNGGFTLTHSFVDGSPALNAADPTNTDLDQIGQSVFGGRRDIGAFECQTCSAIGVGENGASSSKLLVYPNPSFNGSLNIKASANDEVSVKLIDNSGKILASGNGLGQVHLNTENLGKGIYILKIEVNGITENSRVMKL